MPVGVDEILHVSGEQAHEVLRVGGHAIRAGEVRDSSLSPELLTVERVWTWI